MGRSVASKPASRTAKSLLGLRRQPGRFALAVFRLPLRLRVRIGRESFTPDQRFLTEDESLAVVAEFQRQHSHRSRLLASILGWGDLRSDAAARDFVRTRPFVALRPARLQPRLEDGDRHD